MVENLEAQKFVVETAQQLFPQKPVFVSPITLKQRFNVVATSKEPEPSHGELPPQVDERQNSVSAAQWLLGSLKYLAQSGAGLATFFETVGWRGFIQGNFEPPVPEKFNAKTGDVFPVYQLLKEFVGFQNVLFSESNKPLEIDGLVLKNKEQIKMLLTNFTENILKVEIKGFSSWRFGKILFSGREFQGKEIINLPPNEILVLTK